MITIHLISTSLTATSPEPAILRNVSSNPIPVLREILKRGFSVKKEIPAKRADEIRTFVFSFPDKAYLQANTSALHLEFESGRNWVLAIERCISGFSNYMYKKFRGGKSGKGVQIKGKIDSCLLYTSPSPRDQRGSRLPSSA